MKKVKKIILVIFALTFLFSVFKVGKAFAGQEDFKLTGVEIVDKSSDVTGDITSFDDDKIVTNIIFHKVGSYYNMQLTIKNNTDKDYTIETITDTNSNQYIDISYDKHEGETFASKASFSLEVKGTYKESVNDKTKRDQVNEYTITIKLVNEDGEEEEHDIPVVPITGDNITLYVIMAIVSLMVLIVTGLYGKKQFKKSMLVMILLLPLIVKAVTVNVIINIKDNLGLYDKVVVTLNRDGDKEERLIDYDTTISSPTAPEKEGYTFKGWTKEDETYDFSNSFKEDTELVAVYEKNKYDVSYEYFDDSANKTVELPSTTEKEFEANVTVENGLTLQGYTFDGWYKGEDKVTSFTMPAGDVVLKGRFTPNDDTAYKVEFYYQEDGVYGEPRQVTARFGTTDTEAQVEEADKVPQLEGYVLDDTNTGKVYSGTITGDGELKLKVYFKQQFTITFKPGEHGTFTEAKHENLDYNDDTPATPTVTGDDGYTHVGWDPELSSKVTDNKTYTALWEANSDTTYKTEYYWQDVEGNGYTLHETVPGTGTTDTEASAVIKTYTGFTHDAENANKKETGNIDGNGGLTLKVYYNRNVRTVAYQYLGNPPTNAPAVPTGGTYRYGATVPIATAPTLDGYTFSGWSRTEAFTMPDENVLITGSWTANGNTPYKVEHYQQNINDDDYTMALEEPLTGQTDTEAVANPKTFEGFSYDVSNPNNVKSDNINGSGNTVLKLYYNRNNYPITYSYTNNPTGANALPTGTQYRFGKTYNVAGEASAPGYTFDGWYKGSDKVTSFVMPASEVTLTGTFVPGTSNYTVEYYYQVNGTYPSSATDSDSRSGTTDTNIAVTNEDKVPQQTGYVLDENKVSDFSGTITGDGNLKLKVYFKQQFSVTYAPGTHGTFASTTTENLDYNANTPANPTITGADGYTFANWDPQVTPQVTQTVTYVAQWTANTNTPYKVEHWTEKLDGTYELLNGNTETKNGTTDTEATAQSKEIYGFTYDEDNANNVKTGNIDGNGSRVLKLYYNRNQWKVTYSYTNEPTGAPAVPAEETYKYGANVPIASNPTLTGYTFNGWKKGDDAATPFEMPNENVSITGSWTVHTNTVTYTVSGEVPSGYTVPTVDDPVAYGTTVTVAAAPSQAGYTFTGWATENASISENKFVMPDGPVTLTGVWAANTDTAYSTEYYWQDPTGDGYSIHETIPGTGKTDTTANAVINTYTGFTHNTEHANKLESGNIDGSGNLVLRVYYDRNTYNVTYSYTDPKPTDATALPTETAYRYGAEVTVAGNASGTGYTFNGWTLSETVTDGKFVMPDGPVAITGSWTVHTNTLSYSVSGEVPSGYTVPTVTDPVAYGTTVTVADAPTRDGYTFVGWTASNVTITNNTFAMPDEPVTLTGTWTANTNTPYSTEYYWQDVSGSGYTIHETIPGTGKTDTTANADIKTYTGFTHNTEHANKLESGNINGDGSLVLRVYYDRNVRTVTYQYTGTNIPANAPAVPTGGSYRYGANVGIASNPQLDGYTFSGWSRTESFTMPDENVLITGTWTANGDTAYTIKYYGENLAGTDYIELDTKNETGTTDTPVTANVLSFTGFTYDTTNANNLVTDNIKGDGSLVLKLYYKRNSYQLSYSYSPIPTGASTLPTGGSKKYEEPITVADKATAPGYTFDGWYKGTEKVTTFTMPAETVELTGTFTPGTSNYTVEYYYQVDGVYPDTATDSVGRSGTTDTTIAVTDEDKTSQQTGYVLDGSKTDDYSGTITGDGNLKLKVYFKQQFSVTYAPGDHGTFASTTTNNLDYNADTPANPTISGDDGYTFANWDPQVSPKVTQTVTYVAQWTANTNTAYSTEYYWQDPTGDGYSIHETIPGTGTTDAPINAVINTYPGFTHNEEHANRLESSTIKGDGTLVLKVYYDRNTYNVTYSYIDPKPSDATALPTTVSYRYGAEVTVAGNATGTGYTFNGWTTTDASISGGKFVMPNEPVAITGSWTVHTNTVTYTVSGEIPNGYTVPTVSDPVAFGTEVTVEPAPSRAGYTFTGWTTENATINDNKFTMPDGPVTLTGVWAANTNTAYNTEYYWQDPTGEGYSIHETIPGTGKTDTEVYADIKTYTGFTHNTGHSNKLETATIAGDGSLVLRVYYDRNTYSVTYNYTEPKPTDATALPTTVSYRYGQEVTVAPDATGTGYTFNGWTLSETVTDGKFVMPDGPVVITGSWTVHTNTVTYTVSGEVPSGYTVPTVADPVAYGTTFTVADEPTIDGYTFTGWKKGTEKVTSFTMPDENVTLAGVWAANTNTPYSTEYYWQDPTGDGYSIHETIPGSGKTDTTANADIKTYTGFTHNTEHANKLESGNIDGSGNLVLRVYYDRNVRTVTYQYTGTNIPTNAPAVPAEQTYRYGANVGIASNPELTGYTFSGWKKGEADATPFTMPDENVTITGSWTVHTHNITYTVTGDIPEGFVAPENQSNVAYGTNITLPTVSTVAGYEFSGWSSTNATITNNEFSMPDNDVTVTASWEALNVNYKVQTYLEENGSYNVTPTEVTRQAKTGTTVSVTDADKNAPDGYVLDNTKTSDYTGTVLGDGSLTLKVYFKQQFTVTYEPGTKGTFTTQTTSGLDYGANTPAEPDTAHDVVAGYHFTGWNPTWSSTVTETVTYVAQWAPDTDTPYTIKIYYQTPNTGTYPEEPTTVISDRTGTTGTTASVTDQDKSTVVVGYVLDDNAPDKLYSGTIAGDGSLVLKIYFKQQLTVTYEPGTKGTFTTQTTSGLDYGANTPDEPDTEHDVVAGYHFTGWNPTRTATVTETVTYVAQWAPDTDTPYTIEYYLETLNDGYVKNGGLSTDYTDNETGTTDTTANTPNPPKAIANYTFDSTNANNVTSGTIAGDGSLVLKLYYKLNVYTVTFNTTTGHTYNGDAIIEDVVITKRHGEELALSELPTKPTYDPDTLKQAAGVAVNKQHNALLGWYTTQDGDTKITEPVTITENKIYYAHWESVPLMCKKATTLHTATCSGKESGCIKENKYTVEGEMQSTTIVYGETSASTTPAIGDAYDCDINNDQVYDSVHERFYYIGADGNNAVMIYYSNWDGEKIDTTQNYSYNVALTILPTTLHTEWYNIDNPTRFITLSEVLSLCQTTPNGNEYKYKGCEYLLERSGFEQDVPPNNVRSGIWMMKQDGREWRIHTRTLELEFDSQKNAVKPVVLIPISSIEDAALDTYTVTYNAMGGYIDSTEHTRVDTIPAGSAIRIPPTPTKQDNRFEGWYTSEECTEDTKIVLPVIVNSDLTYYAKWSSISGNAARIGNVEYATLQEAIDAVEANGSSPTTIQLLKDVTEDIVIDGNRNILLNLLGHTITNDSDDGHLLTINSGSTLNIQNGNLTSDSSEALIYNAGTLNVTGGTYSATGTGGGIVNDGGDITLTNAYLFDSSSSTNPTIHNNGTLQINSGTISSSGTHAIYNESGSLQIGTEGNGTRKDPVIQGATYGIVSEVEYRLYDGDIRGQLGPLGVASGDPITITPDSNMSMIADQDPAVVYVLTSVQDGAEVYQTVTMEYYTQYFIITFDAGSGNPATQQLAVERNETQQAIGSLASIQNPTRGGYTFKGWYTGENGTGDLVTAETIPVSPSFDDPYPEGNPYITYYAYWEESETIQYEVTFMSQDVEYDVLLVDEGEALSSIPEPTREGYYFNGWYTVQNTEGQAIQGDKLLATTTFNSDATYYAYWINLSDKEAYIENNGERVYYTTIESAITAVPTNQSTPTTIKLIKNINITSSDRVISTGTNKNIILDSQNYLIKKETNNVKKHLFTVGNGSTLELVNGNMEAKLGDGMLQVDVGGVLKITSGTYKATGTRAAAVAEGGTIYISGSPSETIISATTNVRPAVQINKGSGNSTVKGAAYITGGTIISTGGYAIHNANGTLNIGTQGTPLSNESPVIQGATYGVAAYSNFNFYDGIIKGGTYPVGKVMNQSSDGWSIDVDNNGIMNEIINDTDNSKINAKEANTQYAYGNETIDNIPYQTLYLLDENTIYILSFNPGAAGNNANISNDKIIIDRGDEIGVLPTASWDATHTFDGWYTDANGGTKISSTTQPTGDNVNITYYAHWTDETPAETYTLSFNANGGTGSMDSVTDLYGTYTLPTEPANTLVAPEGKRFKGWSLTSNGETITTVNMNQDITVYAIWEDIPTMVCRKATSLNHEECNCTDSSKGCQASGYELGEEITYGQLTNSSQAGFALDCDVDGTGYNKRFYYLRTVDDKAVLIANENFADNVSDYDTGLTMLPTADEWSNIPTSFEFAHPTNGEYTRVARFVNVDDLKAAANTDDVTTIGSLDGINFIFENSKYANATGSSTVWIQKIGDTRARYHKDGRSVVTIKSGASSTNSVRPVIEVPIEQIDLNFNGKYTVTYNANGGTVTPTSEEVDAGATISSLPVPIYADHIFDGWYTAANGGTLVTSIVATSNKTIYAHYANINTSDAIIEVNKTHNVFNTAPSNMSNYNIVSGDTSIATVNNGVITGVSSGSTTITITSATYENQATIVINVEVAAIGRAYTTSEALTYYFENVSAWETAETNNPSTNHTTYLSNLENTFNTYNCSYCGAVNNCDQPEQDKTYCDQPEGYDTGVNGNVNVYTYVNGGKGDPVTYTTSTNGIIYNMIPGEKYYWEDASDSSVYGVVEAEGERRTIYSSVRNVRDLGGMEISYTDQGVTKTGTIKYGKLYRGAQITSAEGVTELTKLGINREIDLRKTSNEGQQSYKLSNYDKGTSANLSTNDDIIIVNYHIHPEPTAYLPSESDETTVNANNKQCGLNHLDEYGKLKETMKYVMQQVVDGDKIFFHCTIGSDRTGTLAYFLEGLLGVSEMDRLRDYELSYFYGMTNRSRYHDYLSGSSINPRFYSMYLSYPTNEDIYEFFTYNDTAAEKADDDLLIAQFRQAMIDFD